MVTLSELYPSGSDIGGGWSVTNGLTCLFSSANSRSAIDGSNRVTHLADMSQNFYVATQETVNTKPLFSEGLISATSDANPKYAPLSRIIYSTSFSFFFKTKSATDATTIALAYPILSLSQSGVIHWLLGGVARRSGTHNIYGYAGLDTSILLQENILPSIANSTEYLLTFLKSSTQWTIYRDGVLAATISDTTTPSAGISTVPMLLSSASAGNTNSLYSRNGQAFRYAAVYNRVVTNDERIQIESDINAGKYI